VLETVVRYRVQAQRAEILGLTGQEDEKPPPELWVEMRLEAFEKRLRGEARVVEAHRLHVPYWHVTGWIAQGILGRRSEGPKLVRLRAFAVEHSVPAYDTDQANLRDRGLRLSRSRVRPLTVREVRERGAFLPWLPVADRPYREIDRYKGQDLDPGLQPVTKYGAFLDRGRVLVYRPYWLARVATDTDQWILADGGFGTLAGHPDEDESRALLGLAIADPLRSGEPSFRRVHVVASRCPECGHEKALPAGNHVIVCRHRPGAHDRRPARCPVRSPCAARAARRRLPSLLRYWFRIEMAPAAIESLRGLSPRALPAGRPARFWRRRAPSVPALRPLAPRWR
jgi:hypothetical protein